ncbi:TraR/DksA family transcriptional regulator [Roseateles sp.]|uniref:TraR/DksA family transcriptional regulator n=1 Tax=Roseateles sp. TaxID=1971397 RepID=UPI0025F2AE3E|nr:TraR/DksA family transcriptional regulator [Roseateles sp.]
MTDANFEREVTDQKDEAEHNEATQIEETQRALELAELVEVEAALERLAGGSYGNCVDCGEAIPLARLGANPAATRCAACQSAQEVRQRLGI